MFAPCSCADTPVGSARTFAYTRGHNPSSSGCRSISRACCRVHASVASSQPAGVAGVCTRGAGESSRETIGPAPPSSAPDADAAAFALVPVACLRSAPLPALRFGIGGSMPAARSRASLSLCAVAAAPRSRVFPLAISQSKTCARKGGGLHEGQTDKHSRQYFLRALRRAPWTMSEAGIAGLPLGPRLIRAGLSPEPPPTRAVATHVRTSAPAPAVPHGACAQGPFAPYRVST